MRLIFFDTFDIAILIPVFLFVYIYDVRLAIAQAYHYGTLGVNVDLTLAVLFYERAARAGDLTALLQVCVFKSQVARMGI